MAQNNEEEMFLTIYRQVMRDVLIMIPQVTEDVHDLTTFVAMEAVNALGDPEHIKHINHVDPILRESLAQYIRLMNRFDELIKIKEQFDKKIQQMSADGVGQINEFLEGLNNE